MAPTQVSTTSAISSKPSAAIMDNNWRQFASDEDFILESWSEGFMVGALLIMACITIANMRKGVLLHKLILAEQLFAMMHGTFCFMGFAGYGWYLSSTASLLYMSWLIHNTVAWLKIRPFFLEPRSMFKPKTGIWVKNIYVGTLILSAGPIFLQIVDNFLFFNNLSDRYKHVRPYEPLMRDPWWVFTCITLFHVIRKCYGTGTFELIKRSPRFGILLCAIILAMVFTVCDIVASIHNITGSTDGINPWWKLSLVFKCLTDTIMLDDFKTELKKLGIKRIQSEENRRQSFALVLDDDVESKDDHDEVEFPHVLHTEAGRNRDLNGGPRRPVEKVNVGRNGKKISHLPGLGKFHTHAVKSEAKTIGKEKDRDRDKFDDCLAPDEPTLQERRMEDREPAVGSPQDLHASEVGSERVRDLRKSLGAAA